MTELIRRRPHRLIAAAGVVALGVTSFFGATAALAVGPEGIGNIDANRKGSIVIHKHEQQVQDAAARPDGTGTLPSSKGIDGVTFSVRQIATKDLTTDAGWAGIDKADAAGLCALPAADAQFASALDVVTANGGLATASDLAVGAYVVCETDAPPTIVNRAAPFIVTIPLPFENGWLYNVNVYPKNSVGGGIAKENAPQQELKVGNEVAFNVKADVAVLNEKTYWEYFRIVDNWPAELTQPGVRDVKLGDTELAAADYTVAEIGAGANKQVILQLTAAGMLKAKQMAPAPLTAQFFGTLTALPENGITANTAFTDSKTLTKTKPTDPDPVDPVDPTDPITPPDPTDPTDPPITPTVKSNWGDIRAFKFTKNDAGEKVGLAGAVFEVYGAIDPYPASADCSAAVKTGLPVDEVTSSAKGLVQFTGLFVSDTTHAPKDSSYRCYVLVEKTAPAGYVKAADKGVAVKIGQTEVSVWDSEIENVQQIVPGLPLTGSQGQMILIAGGIALLGVAAGTAILARRKAGAQV